VISKISATQQGGCQVRRLFFLVVVVALTMSACSDDSSSSTTTEPATATTGGSPDTTVSSPEEDIVEWDEDLADQLVTLESANEGQWTVETALEAVPLVRQGLESGVNTFHSPVDITRLTVFLNDNLDQIPEEEWNALFATGPSTRLVAFQTDPAIRQVYQDLAEETSRQLGGRLGRRLIERVYVALSDYAMPADLYAGTTQWDGDPSAFRTLFRDQAVYQQAADDLVAMATVSDEICIVVLGQDLLGWDTTRQLAGIAHELVHCYQHVTHPGGAAAFFASRVQWMDEGYAAWAGEDFVGGGTSISKDWWDKYFDRRFGRNRDSYQLFDGSYNAIGFYAMLNRAGVDVWGNFVPWFGTVRANNVSDVNRYITMTAGGNTDVIAGWTASATRNSDFGSPWDSENGPGVGNSTRSRNPTPQRVLSESTMRAEPGEQRYRLAQVQTPVDAVSIITVAANGVGLYRWQYGDWEEQFIVNGSYEKSWCVGEDCVCEDGTSPVPDMDVAPIQAGQNPDLHAAMWGAARGADLTVSVNTLEDECEEEEVPTGPLDACLFGTWNPDPQQFQDLILTLYRTIPGISGLTLQGTIDLTFSDDGTFTHVYNGVEGSGTVQGQTIEGSWAGGTFGRWEASGGLLTLTFTGSDIVVTVGPTTARPPGIPTESVDAPYTCGSTAVEFQPPDTPGNLWPLPENWTKVG
jgi:hypothetical protein